ncbi:uncharacterized protein LOC128251499 [Octopus bimaculoides]|uniref:uncharacterized protein LOC128251499 n=1 Tax=Octopus bimaculoides TaxID=37653 RepID=UPI0022DED9B4|nr:uncharacterized protein LOC128251499 [Octopus bimaculoides]
MFHTELSADACILFVNNPQYFVILGAVGIKMAFTVLGYAQTQSNKSVQRACVRVFSKKSPMAMQIWKEHKKFKAEGYLYRVKGSGRPLTSEETVEQVRQKLLRSPKKFIRRTSLETQIPPTTVRGVLRKR